MSQKTQITQAFLKTLAPQAERYEVWDEEITGFGIRVAPTGRLSWIYQYRTKAGKQGRLTLGVYPVVRVSQAREKAALLRAAVMNGKDPALVLDPHKGAFTVADLSDRFLKEYAERKLRPNTIRGYKDCLRLHILPALGKEPVDALTAHEVATWHSRVGLRFPRMANLSLAVLSKMMNLAIAPWALRTLPNPCLGIEKFKAQKRARFMTSEEGRRFAAALATSNEDPYTVAAFLLLLLTGCRRNEIRLLRWAQVDMANRLLRIDGKTGLKAVPLNMAAVRLLESLPKRTDNPYVIASVNGGPVANINNPWMRLRKLAGLDDLRLHDLRHSFASFGVTYGKVPLESMRDLLGHSTVKTTEIYGHLIVSNPVMEASERVGAVIEREVLGHNP